MHHEKIEIFKDQQYEHFPEDLRLLADPNNNKVFKAALSKSDLGYKNQEKLLKWSSEIYSLSIIRHCLNDLTSDESKKSDSINLIAFEDLIGKKKLSLKDRISLQVDMEQYFLEITEKVCEFYQNEKNNELVQQIIENTDLKGKE